MASHLLIKVFFQFAVEGIYEGNTLLQDFDDFWQDNEFGYLTYFQLE